MLNSKSLNLAISLSNKVFSNQKRALFNMFYPKSSTDNNRAMENRSNGHGGMNKFAPRMNNSVRSNGFFSENRPMRGRYVCLKKLIYAYLYVCEFKSRKCAH